MNVAETLLPEKAGLIEPLERLPDVELQEVLKKGQAILVAREQEMVPYMSMVVL